MRREVLWVPWSGEGCEHLRLEIDPGYGSTADGLMLGVADGQPFRAWYQVRCDDAWRVRTVQVEVEGSDRSPLTLLADGEGRWTTGDGEELTALDGCIDVDISATPFTNTLPIRRLHLPAGVSADLAVAYFSVPDLTVVREPQRYTCLKVAADGGTYRFLSLDGGFTAELGVDADGLVLDYPELFRRVWPR